MGFVWKRLFFNLCYTHTEAPSVVFRTTESTTWPISTGLWLKGGCKLNVLWSKVTLLHSNLSKSVDSLLDYSFACLFIKIVYFSNSSPDRAGYLMYLSYKGCCLGYQTFRYHLLDGTRSQVNKFHSFREFCAKFDFPARCRVIFLARSCRDLRIRPRRKCRRGQHIINFG